MLSTLRLKNFVVIEDQTIEFERGFIALSGESGAGKSVLVRALEFVCGGKLALSPIRDEARGEAEVEAHFVEVHRLSLSWMGVDATKQGAVDMGSEFVLRRTYSPSGRTRSWINGQLATQAQLEELSEQLVSITSQSQSVRLRHPAAQRELFDQFAGAVEVARQVNDSFSRWKKLATELETRRAAAEEGALRRASLQFIVDELSAVELEPGKREQLESQLREASHRSKLLNQVGEVLNAPVGSLLGKALTAARELHDGELEQRVQGMLGDWEAVTDSMTAATKRLRGLEDAEDSIAEQLAEVARLERKYRTNDAGLVSMLEKAKQELAALFDDAALDELTERVGNAHAELVSLSAQLSKLRSAAASKLSATLSAHLKELGLDGLALSVLLTPLGEPQSYGGERVEFVIGGRPGKPGVPLGNAASGGELSRIFLALLVACSTSSGTDLPKGSKRAASAEPITKEPRTKRTGGGSSAQQPEQQRDPHLETLVFDEIDSGVSGQAARVVGDKLRQLGAVRQVLCVTHLPQVASLATANLRVTKTPGIPPGSNVERLSEPEKVEEIARMLAGYKVTDQARKSATELISSK